MTRGEYTKLRKELAEAQRKERDALFVRCRSEFVDGRSLRRQRKPLPLSWHIEAAQMRNEGLMTLQKIGNHFGVSRERVRQVLGSPSPEIQKQIRIRHGRPNVFQHIPHDDIADLANRLTYRELADKYSVGIRLMRAFCRRHGIKPRHGKAKYERNNKAVDLYWNGAPWSELVTVLAYKNEAAARAFLWKFGCTGRQRQIAAE